MIEDLVDEAEYERHTRSRYRDPAVATRYARRQSFVRSPAEWLVGQLEKIHVRRALDKLKTRGDAWVVDVPAGAGKLEQLLADASGFYCAVDVSSAMLSFGSAPVAVVADAANLPFRSRSVDIVVCLRLLHRVPKSVVAQIIGEIVRVSRAGVIVSYGSTSRFPVLHRFVQSITRRTGQRNIELAPADIATLATSGGAMVAIDRSISFGLTAERVAALQPLV